MAKMWRGAVMVASLGWASLTGCAPSDPFDFGGPRSCEVPDQNEWVYGLMQEAYLWSEDLPAIDPADYDSPSAMIRDLRVGEDRWSRVSDKGRTNALFQEGKFIGLGYRTRRNADDEVVVADVSKGSPAEEIGMQRGDVIESVEGLTIEQIDQEGRWSDIYGENVPGTIVAIEVKDQTGEVRPFTITKDWIDIDTVPVHGIHEVAGRKVGYLLFATFVDTATSALDQAFTEFNQAEVREVVVDLRYNGGGLISVARHFMHLLVGGVVPGHVAYRVRYNDAFSDENTDRGLQDLTHSLPEVDRVVFITTGSSLSASELLINAVRAHVPVTIVGSTTGGKPVGSKHFEFCDSVAAPVTFRLLNADHAGDYFDGLSPDCPAVDDFAHPLGDPRESSLAAALHRLETGQCLPLEDQAEGATVEPAPELVLPGTAADAPAAPLALAGWR